MHKILSKFDKYTSIKVLFFSLFANSLDILLSINILNIINSFIPFDFLTKELNPFLFSVFMINSIMSSGKFEFNSSLTIFNSIKPKLYFVFIIIFSKILSMKLIFILLSINLISLFIIILNNCSLNSFISVSII